MRVRRENSMNGEDKSAEWELLHVAEKSMSLSCTEANSNSDSANLYLWGHRQDT